MEFPVVLMHRYIHDLNYYSENPIKIQFLFVHESVTDIIM
jgi:hypothetical protein